MPGGITEHGSVDIYGSRATTLLILKKEIAVLGRNASASPAVGALALHKREQAQLVKEAFTI